jgi:hypothetical protein
MATPVQNVGTSPHRAHTQRTRALPLAGRWLAAIAGLALPAAFAAADDEAVTTKWNPGHYMLLFLGDSPEQRLKHFDSIADEDVIKGAQVRYKWANLEPREGEYDFSAIEKDLARLQKHGKRLVIQILDRGFNIDSPEGFVPGYLLAGPQYGGGAVKTSTGYAARVWEPAVMDRQIALYEALGRRFDGEPFVEAIGGDETAPALGSNRPAGFSDAKLVEQLSRWIVAVRAAWPRTNVLLYSNWLSGKLDNLVAECARNRCAVGGPDVFPEPNKSTEGDKVLMGLAGGPDYRGRIPVAYAVQPSVLGLKYTHTPAELFEHAYGKLHANYIFWIRNTAYGGPAQRWSTGILPYLREIDGKTHTECPASLEDGCRSGEDRAG